jgi:hypothetical protein
VIRFLALTAVRSRLTGARYGRLCRKRIPRSGDALQSFSRRRARRKRPRSRRVALQGDSKYCARGCGCVFCICRASARSEAARQAGASGPRRGGLGKLRSKNMRRENRDDVSRCAAHLPEGDGGTRAVRALRGFCGARAADSGDVHARGRDSGARRFLSGFRGHGAAVSEL